MLYVIGVVCERDKRYEYESQHVMDMKRKNKNAIKKIRKEKYEPTIGSCLGSQYPLSVWFWHGKTKSISFHCSKIKLDNEKL